MYVGCWIPTQLSYSTTHLNYYYNNFFNAVLLLFIIILDEFFLSKQLTRWVTPSTTSLPTMIPSCASSSSSADEKSNTWVASSTCVASITIYPSFALYLNQKEIVLIQPNTEIICSCICTGDWFKFQSYTGRKLMLTVGQKPTFSQGKVFNFTYSW